MRLRYAAADATAFHQYARTAWEDATGVHHVLTDGNAASRAVSDIFKEIRKAGHFDILVVYLSGHGEVGADGAGWFCLAAATIQQEGSWNESIIVQVKRPVEEKVGCNTLNRMTSFRMPATVRIG